jgi:VWFA-related protein
MPGFSRREFLLTATGTLAWAQDAAFSSSVNVVNVLASVRDKHGNFASDLSREEFTVEEDGRAQTLRYFERQSDLPLTLGLLVDVSTSQSQLIGQEKSASAKFFDQVLREDLDQAFLFRFARRIELLSYLSHSRSDLKAALRRLDYAYQIEPEPSGTVPKQPAQFDGTALFDAVRLSSDVILKKQQGRKALILLSDGVDTGSSTPMARAIEAAQRADALIYSLCFSDPDNDDLERDFGQAVLRTLAEQTGGRYFQGSSNQSFEKIYRLIQDELRNQYSLGYVPDNSGAGYRKIHVSVKRKGLTVQARDGYYADALPR